MYRRSAQRLDNMSVVMLFLFLGPCSEAKESVCPAEFGQCQADTAKGNAMLQNKKLVTNAVSGVEEINPQAKAGGVDAATQPPFYPAVIHQLVPISSAQVQPAIVVSNATSAPQVPMNSDQALSVSQGTPANGAQHTTASIEITESPAEKLRQTILDMMAAAKASNVTIPPAALAVLKKIDNEAKLTAEDVLAVEDAAATIPEFDDDNSAEAASVNHALTTAHDFAIWSGVAGEDIGPNGSVPSYQGDMIPASAEQLSLWQRNDSEASSLLEDGEDSEDSDSNQEEEGSEDSDVAESGRRRRRKSGDEHRRRRRRRRFAGSLSAGAAWTSGKVNYCYASNIHPAVKHVFGAAIHQFQKAQKKCLEFVDVGLKGGSSESPASDQECNQSPAIFVMSKAAGCYSYVGMVASMKSQQLNLAPSGCVTIGIAVHELGHALGMAHEHSRPDRDEHVAINMQNVQSGNSHNFETVAGTFAGEKYDYLSIMHYDAFAFAVNPNIPTITQNDKEYKIGQRTGLSKYDARQIEHIYAPFMDKCESARGLQEEMGCLDRPDDNGNEICAGITSCTAGTVEKCCACGGGFKVQCYKGRSCPRVEPLPPPQGAACILDQTAAYGHQYPCVFTNACSYNIKVVCPSGCTYQIAAGGPRVQQCDGAVDAGICQGKCTVTQA